MLVGGRLDIIIILHAQVHHFHAIHMIQTKMVVVINQDAVGAVVGYGQCIL